MIEHPVNLNGPAILLLVRSTDIQVLYLTCIIAMNRAKGGRQLHVTTF